MDGTAKFAVGAAATAVMALIGHGVFGMGQGVLNRIGVAAEARLYSLNAPGVTATMQTAPTLQRTVILSGPASEAEKSRLLAAMRTVSGVGAAKWVADPVLGTTAASAAAGAETSGSETAAAGSTMTAPGAAMAPPAAPPANVPAANVPADARTCQTRLNAAMAGKSIGFGVSTATLDASAAPILDSVASVLKACGGAPVEVGGHTDPSGSAVSNLALSDARAKAVVTALIQRGVPANRLTARGYGSTRLIDDTFSIAAYARNRRIEFVVAGAAPAAGQETR